MLDAPPLDLLPALLPGLAVTLQVFGLGAVVAAVASLSAGLGRVAHDPIVRSLAGLYVAVFRGTSALVQLFWVFFALPLFGLELSPLVAAVVVLGLNTGAYGAEAVRGAIVAVPQGQWEAASALGFSRRQVLWRVILPQALPRSIGPAGNLLIELLKNTSLVSLITLTDLTFAAQAVRADTLRTAEAFGLVLLLYYAVSRGIAAGTHALERRLVVAVDV